MAATQYIPYMEPGATAQNVVVGLLYVVTAPFWIISLWLTVPFVVWTDMDGIAGALSFLPGIEEGGGFVSAAVAFIYVALLFFAAIAVINIPPPENGVWISKPDGAGLLPMLLLVPTIRR